MLLPTSADPLKSATEKKYCSEKHMRCTHRLITVSIINLHVFALDRVAVALIAKNACAQIKNPTTNSTVNAFLSYLGIACEPSLPGGKSIDSNAMLKYVTISKTASLTTTKANIA